MRYSLIATIIVFLLSCNNIENKSTDNIFEKDKMFLFQKETINLSECIPFYLDSILKEDYFDKRDYMSILFEYTGRYVALYDGEKLNLIDVIKKSTISLEVKSNIVRENQFSYLVSSSDEIFLMLGKYHSKKELNNLFYLYKYNSLNESVELIDSVVYPRDHYIIGQSLKMARTMAFDSINSNNIFINNKFKSIQRIENGSFNIENIQSYAFDIIQNRMYRYEHDSITYNGKNIINLRDYSKIYNDITFGKSIAIHDGLLFFKDEKRMYLYIIEDNRLEVIENIDVDVMDYYKYGFYKFSGLYEQVGEDIFLDLYKFKFDGNVISNENKKTFFKNGKK